MCTTCGCGTGEARVDGAPLDREDPHHHHPYHHHQHSHQHGDGVTHSHPHDHHGDHGHGTSSHDHGHDPHWHQHADGTWHSHDHGHPHEHSPADHDHRPEGTGPGTLHYGKGPARAHAPGLSQTRMVQIETDILAKNDGYAGENRALLAREGVLALNLVSSPGSGKTTLLVRTLGELPATVAGEIPLAVIEGDQETAFDAERIRATGVPAIQVNTGKGCHLDAHMVGRALEQLPLETGGVLFIENVGNLVCPAAFDLGEAAKVAILSVTEGADKPLKYPDMFHAARLLLINKVDLLPYVDFDLDQAIAYARQVNPGLEVITLSARSGEGLSAWYDWLRARREEVLAARAANPGEMSRLQARIAELEAEVARLRNTGR